MNDANDPIEQALDLLFYAPVGFAFSLRELVPGLAEKGRQQVTMARAVGEFAVTMAQRQAEKLLHRDPGTGASGASSSTGSGSGSGSAPRTSAAAPASAAGASAPPASPAAPSVPQRAAPLAPRRPAPSASPAAGGSVTGQGGAGRPGATGARGTTGSSRPPSRPPAPPRPGPARVPGTGSAVRQLAIPGYDALSASQVLPRLAGLTRPELEAVRAYEEAGRGRKTVLNRIAQLQAAN